MKIKILNKNSNKIFDIDEGSVFTENYNETLDSATVIINNVEEDDRLQIEPYDVVEIFKYDGTKWKCMCVDTYTETMICVNPKIYRYQISLFSETKLLEGVILPNLKITKMPGINRPIYYYINQYLTEYCPQIRIPDDSSYSLTNKFNWAWENSELNHDKLSVKFKNECPEMQWNTPTLREVLNNLMMINDCIVILKNGRIEYIDITEIKNTIDDDDEHINYVTRSKSSEDYVSELQVDLQNVTNEQLGNVNTVTRVEYVPFMTEQTEVALKTTTAFVKTKYPIYKIKSLKIMFPGKIGTYDQGASDPTILNKWMEYDLMTIPKLVCEYQEYITRPVIYKYIPGQTYYFGESQNLSIYYTRGTNKIEGFFRSTKQLLWMSSSLFDNLTENIAEQKLPSSEWWVPTGNQCEYYQAMFKVEYETLEGCLFRASKGDNPDNQKIVIDNQTNSMIDSYSQGFLEYQKANRLGNEQLQINARYAITDTFMEIGDAYENTIIYQVQYQYYKDHVEVNALATKNYVLREYFTGVKSKIRSWKIADGSDALTRHDLSKYYCEFSWKYHPVKYTGNVPLQLIQDSAYFFTPFISYNAEPLKYVAIQLTSSRKLNIPDYYQVNTTIFETYYCLDLINRIVGNSLVFNFGFEDNYYLEKAIDTSVINLQNQSIDDEGIIDWADTINLGGEPLEQYGYTDDLGETTICFATFASGLKTIPYLPANDGGTYTDPYDGLIINPANDDRRQFQFYCYFRPRIFAESLQQTVTESNKWNYKQIFNSYSYHKDSQEIPKYSTQFEFCSETNDICFTKEFLKRQKAININDNIIVLDLCGYDIKRWHQKFNFRRPDEFPNIERVIQDPGVTVQFAANNNGTYHMEITSPYVFDTENEAENYIKNKKDYAWYLVVKSDDGNEYADGSEPILLVFTNIPNANIFATKQSGGTKYAYHIEIYMNILKIRNKNIYDPDDHYLITGKI